MNDEMDIPKAISGLFKRLRAVEKRIGTPTQAELAATVPGGHSEKFEWEDWEPDYKALYESERQYVKRQFEVYSNYAGSLEFLISILAAVKPLDGSVGKEVW